MPKELEDNVGLSLLPKEQVVMAEFCIFFPNFDLRHGMQAKDLQKIKQ